MVLINKLEGLSKKILFSLVEKGDRILMAHLSRISIGKWPRQVQQHRHSACRVSSSPALSP